MVVETLRADWSANRFRNDLWLYRDDSGGSLVQLTHSGHDSSPQWSPDGGRDYGFAPELSNISAEYNASTEGPESLGGETAENFRGLRESRSRWLALTEKLRR